MVLFYSEICADVTKILEHFHHFKKKSEFGVSTSAFKELGCQHSVLTTGKKKAELTEKSTTPRRSIREGKTWGNPQPPRLGTQTLIQGVAPDMKLRLRSENPCGKGVLR